MRLPSSIQNLIESFERLPGIGPKTAQRLAFYLLHNPQGELQGFANALTKLKTDTKICSICKNIGENDPCEVCGDDKRDKTKVCVAETPLDAIAIEKSGYRGLYHILHGVINPLQNIGPDEIFIKELVTRIENDENINEVIIATGPTMEGETTAFYISKLISNSITNNEKLPRPLGHPFSEGELADTTHSRKLQITRIGRGLPTGASIEYADETTIERAMKGRTEM